MKYMGSKRAMLQKGLGQVLDREAASAKRFVDLFSGSGVVAAYVARNLAIPVHAIDVQRYSVILTNAVVGRKKKVAWKRSWKAWHRRAMRRSRSYRVPSSVKLTQTVVKEFRKWCIARNGLPITKAYGGHYFSPRQSVWIDSLRATLPTSEPTKTVALAALIRAASKCAASPGHTAQPFQPTKTAKRHLMEAWRRDVAEKTKLAFEELSGQFAQLLGRAVVGDANEVAERLRSTDLVFIDPPYSGVHYSRFYHVLESVSRGGCGEVSGVGRYPPTEKRP